MQRAAVQYIQNLGNRMKLVENLQYKALNER
jgi:hypothetical protein